MAWDKNNLISTHTIKQPMIDKIMSMGPRGYEWLKLAAGGSIPEADALVPIDANLAEVLLARGPRAAFMAQVLTGDIATSGGSTGGGGSGSGSGGGGGSTGGTGGGGPTIPAFGVDKVSDTEYRMTGFWPVGTEIHFSAMFQDANGQSDTEGTTVVLPAGAPEGGWPAATAAAVVAGGISDLPHIDAMGDSGGTIIISLTETEHTLIGTDLTV